MRPEMTVNQRHYYMKNSLEAFGLLLKMKLGKYLGWTAALRIQRLDSYFFVPCCMVRLFSTQEGCLVRKNGMSGSDARYNRGELYFGGNWLLLLRNSNQHPLLCSGGDVSRYFLLGF